MITGKKIGAAVLGLGEMGATHLQSAKDSPWVDKIVGYEPTSELAQKLGKIRDVPATSDLNSILNDPNIHLIYIAAPNEVHTELAVKALRAGKAVLCEKPMGTTLDEARRMIQAEKETGSFLQIGLELRYSKLYLKAKEWIEQGLIGKPLNSHCDYYCSEFHKKGTWRSKGKTTLIAEKLCHYLDLPRWWMEDQVENVYSVSAPNTVMYFSHSDNHQITYRFKNGAVGTLVFFMHTASVFDGDPLQNMQETISQQADDGHRLTYIIYGTKGVIETDVFRRRARRWELRDAPEKLESVLVETITYPGEKDLEWTHNVHGQGVEISRLVAQGLPPGTSASDSLETMKLVFAAELAERENRIILMSELRD
ncbi:MAG: Gfo/Idh/MocA family oxidoreductase [Candidatus Ratteibacteria bacterium]|jgi:predicted dehydrogenase